MSEHYEYYTGFEIGHPVNHGAGKFPDRISYDESKCAMVAYVGDRVVGECSWSLPPDVIADWILKTSQTKFREGK